MRIKIKADVPVERITETVEGMIKRYGITRTAAHCKVGLALINGLVQGRVKLITQEQAASIENANERLTHKSMARVIPIGIFDAMLYQGLPITLVRFHG